MLSTTTDESDIIAGRKTFFIMPDITVFPQSFLEDYLAEGCECYFIERDNAIPLAQKLDIIISYFHDVILFFNIDAQLQDINWQQFIKALLQKYNNQLLIGVLYSKRYAESEKTALERTYLFDMGLQCGCIEMKREQKLNYVLISKILYANQATGRRKNVRAICNSSCRFSLKLDNTFLSGEMRDISLSHFTCAFPAGKLNLKMYDKIKNVEFNIKGLHFKSDIVLCIQRQINDAELFVFTFLTEDGRSGLDAITKQNLIPKMHELMESNCKRLIQKIHDDLQEQRLQKSGK